VTLFTIGHSNHAIDLFLDLVRRHEIETVADVRSRPYSRFVPHYRKETLARTLAEADIGYLYLGRELGGRPPSGDVAVPVPDYASRTQVPAFRTGIDRLMSAMTRQPVALLCRERDPLDCHRFHLICRHLRATVSDIRHVLPDGSIEPQAVTERRLLERAGLRALPLFGHDGDDDALESAYDRWWQKGR
jgi:uncharacterized protein (DUF488 family)